MAADFPTLRQVVLACPDVRELAEFYRRFLGFHHRPGDEPPADRDWVGAAQSGGRSPARLPASPRPPRGVLAGRSARLLRDRSDDPVEPLRVYADPAGHPFCVFVVPSPA